MEIASLILGIISILFIFFPPILTAIAVLASIIGLILGIISLVQKKKHKASSIWGVVLSSITLALLIFTAMIATLAVFMIY